MKRRRTYIGEIEWGIGRIRMAHSDSNPNREAQISRALDYLNEVLIARRSKLPVPPRPDPKGWV